MTVNTTTSRIIYSGNGSTTEFPTEFIFFDSVDLVVTLVSSAGVETVQTITTNYTVSGGDGANGTVTMLVAPASGESLVIQRQLAQTQGIDYQPNDPFPAETNERGLDRLTMLVQQVKDIAERALVLPITTMFSNLTVPEPVIDNVLVGNSTGTGWDNVPRTQLGGIAGPAGDAIFFDTVAAAQAANIDVQVNFIFLGGHTTAGDRGAALYKRVVSEPTHPGKLTSNDGAFWELSESTVTPEMFGAVGDKVADDLTAIQNAVTYVQATGGERVFLPAKNYRVTNTIDLTDLTTPIAFEGAGWYQTTIFGDFTGPDQGIVDLSFTTQSDRINGNVVRNLAFESNGVVGDPIAIKWLNAQQGLIEHISVSGAEILRNSGLFLTEANNIDINHCSFGCGYQPVIFDLPDTATFSVTSGSGVVTASESVFTAGMVGERLFLGDGGENANSLIFSGVITTFTSGTQVTIDTNASRTASGFRASFGTVTGSITSGNNVLTLSHGVLTSANVGQFIFIAKADDKNGQAGILSTRIASVTNSTTCVLDDNATATASSEAVFFPPAIFIGNLADSVFDRQVNDCVLHEVQIENHESAALLVDRAVALYLTNCKLHGEGVVAGANTFGKSLNNAVFSDCIHVEMKGTSLTWGNSPDTGQIYLLGSRGTLILDGFESAGLQPGQRVVFGENLTNAARLVIGPGWLTHGFTGQADTWRPYDVPDRINVQYGGTINAREGNGGRSSMSSSAVLGGIAGMDRGATISDDSVFKYYPEGTAGLLMVSSQQAGVWGLIWYRTSSNPSGATSETITLGSNTERITGDLTGTTGTDGRVTLSAGTDDAIHVENRRGFDVNVQITPISVDGI